MSDDLLDIQAAAALTGRHPETIRRWVWSGRLHRHVRGRRLYVDRAEIEATTSVPAARTLTLAEWAARARAFQAATPARGSEQSAANLVIEDRARRR